MTEINDVIKSLLTTAPRSEGPTVEGTFEIDQNPSLSRIANNGKALTQNISKLSQTLQGILTGWGVS